MTLEVRAARRIGGGRLAVDAGPPLRWTASANGPGVELEGPSPEAFTFDTTTWIGEQLRGPEGRGWRSERWRRLRAQAGDAAFAGGEPPEDVDGMVYFHEVFPWSFDLTVTHDRRVYAVLDCYCLEPACRCDEVVARFVDLSRDKEIDDAELGTVRTSLRKSGAPSIDGAPLLRELWRVALEQNGRKTFRERYRRMREVARGRRRTEAAASAATVARKAPCPCGSGKKYKRCCGAD